MNDKVSITRPRNHLALVTLDRPEARNAIDADVAIALENAVAMLDEDDDVWAVVLTGAGKLTFSAGADLKEVARGNINKLYTTSGGFAGFVQKERSKPWIAAVEGYALAGGCEIALACDLIVASEESKFGLPEVSRGLIAAAGGVYRLPRAIPKTLAYEMILTGEPWPATRLAAVGLINQLAPAGGVVDRALDLAEKIVRNAPLAVRETLKIARLADDLEDATLQHISNEAQARLSRTDDFAEGPRAFIEKRSPRWSAS